ncbi:hypothetical protein [uncultured Pseudoteredinibacter sp.]|uniref:hypothetical protein n=1 Tax=uncultured Pseudoteredinibacter sp. TaxID=1641701 RepID=UPI00260D1D77|nr:hypothetical protein [uncultured Pseudoteredinibacter sp.]
MTRYYNRLGKTLAWSSDLERLGSWMERVAAWMQRWSGKALLQVRVWSEGIDD